MFNIDPQLFESFMRVLWPAVAIMTSWTAISAYVLIKAPANYYLKWALIPIMLISAIFGSFFLSSNFGYAAPYYLPAHFQFLGYKVENKGFKKSTIEVWVNDKSKTRLYVIPYSKEAEEAFKKAAKLLAEHEGGIVDMDSNGNQIGKGKGKDGHGNGEGSNGADSQYQSHLRPTPSMPPKGPSQFPQFDSQQPSINSF